jgi:hypothetical protein
MSLLRESRGYRGEVPGGNTRVTRSDFCYGLRWPFGQGAYAGVTIVEGQGGSPKMDMDMDMDMDIMYI